MNALTLPWLDLPVAYSIDLTKIRDISTRAAMCGQNTGNFVFRLGLKRLMQREFEIELQPLTWKQMPGRSEKSVIVSCANWLSAADVPFDEYNRLRAQHLKACSATNFILVGIGCNSSTFDISTFKLGPGTIEFLEGIMDRTRLIMTRDSFTRDVLLKHGVPEGMVVTCGCPSNLITDFERDDSVKKRLIEKASLLGNYNDYNELKLVLTQMEVNTPSSLCMDLFGRLAGGADFTYVFQGTSGDEYIQNQSKDFHIRNLESSIIKSQGRSVDDLISVTPHMFQTFYDAEEWGRFCHNCDLSIGQRIHGSVIALQHGTPAILFAHDQRTSGLGAQMRLPIASDQIIQSYDKLVASIENQIHGYIDAQRVQKAWMIECLKRAM